MDSPPHDAIEHGVPSARLGHATEAEDHAARAVDLGRGAGQLSGEHRVDDAPVRPGQLPCPGGPVGLGQHPHEDLTLPVRKAEAATEPKGVECGGVDGAAARLITAVEQRHAPLHRAHEQRLQRGRARRGEQDPVDHVDHSIAGTQVGGLHHGPIDDHPPERCLRGEARLGEGRQPVAVDHVLREHLSGHHVVQEDPLQLRPTALGEELLQGVLAQGREGLIGGSKDGQRALARERFHEPRGLDGGDERGELPGAHRQVHQGPPVLRACLGREHEEA